MSIYLPQNDSALNRSNKPTAELQQYHTFLFNALSTMKANGVGCRGGEGKEGGSDRDTSGTIISLLVPSASIKKGNRHILTSVQQ